MVIAVNRRIAAIPHLDRFVDIEPRAIVGWGRKRSGRRAQRLSRLLNRPCLLLEDGFLRSVGRNDPPISLIADRTGVYYDATTSCDFEQTIAAGVDGVQAARARALAAQWRNGRVSKYNHAPDYSDALPSRFVLVVDQTFGDLSIGLGLADIASFRAMLYAALSENLDCDVVVKVHPDVFTRGKGGWLDLTVPQAARVTVLGSDCHAARLLEEARAVYTVTSLMGFEALLRHKPVRCFGMPFYAGWGLTMDELPTPVRRGRAAFEALVHAALVTSCRYVDPLTGEYWQAEEAIAHVATARLGALPGEGAA